MSPVVLGRSEIEDCLPHRSDALFISQAWLDADLQRNEERRHEARGGGLATWSERHPVLNGHFPGLPIVPGIFLVEGAAQIAGILMVLTARVTPAFSGQGAATPAVLGMLSAIRKVLVHRAVRPGEVVRYDICLQTGGTGRSVVSGSGSVDGHKTVSFELLINVVAREVLGATPGRTAMAEVELPA